MNEVQHQIIPLRISACFALAVGRCCSGIDYSRIFLKGVIQMADCYDCKYAIGDYEEYYGGYRQHIVVGCKLDRDPDTCGEEDDEDEMPEMRK